MLLVNVVFVFSLRSFSDTNMTQDLLLLWVSLGILGIGALATVARLEKVSDII